MKVAIKRSFSTYDYDAIIVGAGPAGLSAAITLQKLKNKNKLPINFILLDKASQIGGHAISGCITNISLLQTLVPHTQFKHTPINRDQICYLSTQNQFLFPSFSYLSNSGLSLVSISEVCRDLKLEYEKLGGEVMEAASVTDLVTNNGIVEGVELHSEEGPVKISSKHVVLAEGAKGYIADKLWKLIGIQNKCSGIYGLGIKEVWESNDDSIKNGTAIHSVGYPCDFGGGFIYKHQNMLTIGYITNLYYKNPNINPYEEFQKFKLHPYIDKMIRGKKRLEYGARLINEGGYYSIPSLGSKGALVIGCAANLLDPLKLKGVENSILSGKIAAEAIYNSFTNNKSSQDTCTQYANDVKKSQFYKQLYNYRNAPYLAMQSKILWGAYGVFPHLFNLLSLNKLAPNSSTYSNASETNYPNHNGTTTFNKEDSLIYSSLSKMKSKESHLKCVNKDMCKESFTLYKGIEQKLCPAGVYEFDENGNLKINHHNCLHCKACSAKVFNIIRATWATWNGRLQKADQAQTSKIIT